MNNELSVLLTGEVVSDLSGNDIEFLTTTENNFDNFIANCEKRHKEFMKGLDPDSQFAMNCEKQHKEFIAKCYENHKNFISTI